MRVRFVKAAIIYNRGEVAGFADDEAARLIADGWAVDVDAEEAAATAEAEAKAEPAAEAKAKAKA